MGTIGRGWGQGRCCWQLVGHGDQVGVQPGEVSLLGVDLVDAVPQQHLGRLAEALAGVADGEQVADLAQS